MSSHCQNDEETQMSTKTVRMPQKERRARILDTKSLYQRTKETQETTKPGVRIIMTDIKVVIGSNFGDEGKGLITDYLAYNAVKNNKNCIVVLTNGGAQRGHNVETPDGTHHTFHHFGSGSLVGADTYCSDYFILSPMTFRLEYEQLAKNILSIPTVYVNKNCLWSSPYDGIVNHIVEEYRDKNRHGSCGMGIWETVTRYNKYKGKLINIYEFNNLGRDTKVNILKQLRDTYFVSRLNSYGVKSVPESWKSIFYSDVLIDNFLFDVDFFVKHTTPAVTSIIKKYNTVIFENGQGLLLDQNAKLYGDNTTPSNTGSIDAHNIIKSVFANSDVNIELCYVSRTYLTRHGAGRFESEYKRTSPLAGVVDRYNPENATQGILRYGEAIPETLVFRILQDAAIFTDYPRCKTSAYITHTNEFKLKLDNFIDCLDTVYTSDTPYRDSVSKVNSKPTFQY